MNEQLDKVVVEAKVLSLRYWDDPVLSTVCAKIDDNEFGPQLEEFGRELIATMMNKNGVGLAAPQVGVTKRMFAMSFPDHKDAVPEVVCNPEILLRGAARQEREGCLSLPGVYEQVIRASEASMKFRRPNGDHAEILLVTAWDARVAQHEFDHLNGIMFFDFKDKREEFSTPEHPEPWGLRMSRQSGRSVLREWDKVKAKRRI